MLENTFYLIGAFLFLGLNAFFVLSEFAIVKVRSTRLQELSEKGNKSASIALEATKHLDAYLSTCQLGITIASLGLGWVGEPAFSKMIDPLISFLSLEISPTISKTISIAVAFSITTALHVVVGELAPKNLAIRIPEKSSILVAIPLKVFHYAMYIPMWILNESANWILKLLNIKQSENEDAHSEEELRIILGQSEEMGRISLGRLMMFEHLFDFGKTQAKEVMTIADNIAYLKTTDTQEEIFKKIKEKKFSRYPVKDSEEKILGFIHIKDIFLSESKNKAESISSSSLREMRYIDENASLEKALKFFQENRIQISLVKSASQKICGLITIEDIVEELTGEIRDEFENPPNFTLNDIFIHDASIFELKSKDRYGAIHEMIDNIFEKNKILDKDQLTKKIIDREKVFSTALGHQVAFPHARIEYLRRPMLIIGKSTSGINFPSPDNMPVKVIFMILTPFNDPTIQLKILSKLSKIVSNITLRKKLLSANKPETISDIFSAFENKIPESTN